MTKSMTYQCYHPFSSRFLLLPLDHSIIMSDEKLVGPELIKSILSQAEKPLSTRELQEEVKKIHDFCAASNVVALNLMRVAGTIKGKRVDRKWVWWV